jgi:hypothetical protein
MATFALSVLIMIVVVGTLAGWAIREERRRSNDDVGEERQGT